MHVYTSHTINSTVTIYISYTHTHGLFLSVSYTQKSPFVHQRDVGSITLDVPTELFLFTASVLQLV